MTATDFVARLVKIPGPGSLVRWSYDGWWELHRALYKSITRNPASRRRFRAQRAPLTPLQSRLVAALRDRGIAMARFDELLPDAGMWEELRARVESFSATARTGSGQAHAASRGPKTYLLRALEEGAVIEADHPLLRVGLHPAILTVVNAYLELWSKLTYTDIWYTINDPAAREAVASQRWHRDPEDERLVKVFLYFSDVSQDAGPFEYIPQSCRGARYDDVWRLPRYCLLNVKIPHAAATYPPPELVEQRVPPHDRLVCTGNTGTLIFCDTSGFHRGGLATQRPRILATWAYVSPASMWARRFTLGSAHGLAESDPPARYALA